jgi:DNA replication protein DnaC
MEIFRSCRKCKKGWIIDEENAQKCLCLIEWQNKVENEIIINNTNLPISIKDYNIKDYIGPDNNGNLIKLKKYIAEFGLKFKQVHLYISGANSSQKTTVVGWLGKEIAKLNHTVLYCTMNEMIKDLIAVERNSELEEKIIRYKESDLLIVDEAFDLTKLVLYQSGYQLSFIDTFLRERLERNKKSTIFISNVYLDLIDLKFGKSLIELIRRNCESSKMMIFEDSINLRNSFEIKDLWK